MKLSLVVPAVRPEVHLGKLLDTLREACAGTNGAELVVVNQSGASARSMFDGLPIPVSEVMTDTVIPAANARNLGAHHASGDFLFFLDDDALLLATPQDFRQLLEELTPTVDGALCQRGELVGGGYRSHWPEGVREVNERNFSALCIEWNVIVRRDLFFAHGAFPGIGTGSRHAALSGEVFMLFARLLGAGCHVRMIPRVCVAHPSLVKPENPAQNLLGYFYGAGYSVGASMRYFSATARLYWLLRVSAASVCDAAFRFRAYGNTTRPAIERLGPKLMRSRFTGFVDGWLGREIKPRQWLLRMV